MHFALYVICLVVALGVSWRYLGSYMAAVFEGRVHWMGWIERPTYRILGVDPDSEQSWQRYATSLIIYSGIAVLVVYGFERLQGHLPLDPQHLAGVTQALSFNTATSFVTNTNWQNYTGEATMSYLTQMVALVGQQFASAAAGMCVMVGMIRGFSRRDSSTIGNFWVDLIRGVYYILLPIAAVAAVIYIGQGAVQTLAGPVTIHDVLNGAKQVLPRGPQGSMTPIKQLGNNGGGYTNANGAHPFENPTAFTQWLSLYLLMLIPIASTYMFGKMVKSIRQGLAVLSAMAILFVSWAAFAQYAESRGNPAVTQAGVVAQPSGNMEGKEVRFGVADTTLFDVLSTQTSTGSVSGSNDSFTPIGGMAMLTGMMLGEVSPGGAGAGMYTILAFAIIAVFIGGLMVGRTPEYLGKKIQAREVKLAGLLVLVMPMLVLILTGIAVSIHAGRAGPENGGPHGFSEILYAYTSPANNNGSAFAGLDGNTAWYNVTQSLAMYWGRFAEMVPALALGGVLASKNVTPESAGTFRTDSGLFVGLLVGTILLVGALVFFPAVALGPVVEQLVHKLYPPPSSLHIMWQHALFRLSLLHGKVLP
ncbi:MAG TPA: potassium-transporting ATPase subunit KdpA [Acidimicrobiales bacterium]|nr:potassium-transporting ATPase subunit KdpA [Acidimicrobiales bacterium]